MNNIDVLERISSMLSRRRAGFLLRVGLNSSEWKALQELFASGRGMRIGDVADKIGISRALMSVMVPTLVGNGWISNEENETDRRSHVITITEPGACLFLEVSSSLAEFEQIDSDRIERCKSILLELENSVDINPQMGRD